VRSRKKGIRLSAFLNTLKDPDLRHSLMFGPPTARMILAEHVLKSRKQANARAAALRRKSPRLRVGRAKGSTNKRTDAVRAHIRDLLKRHAKLSPPQLYRKASPQVIGNMAETTFCNHVRATRNK
jgi:hypothetical protein